MGSCPSYGKSWKTSIKEDLKVMSGGNEIIDFGNGKRMVDARIWRATAVTLVCRHTSLCAAGPDEVGKGLGSVVNLFIRY
jgi:hypothetical protein